MAAMNAEARAFGSVSPARYSAVTAANAARKYVLAIAISFAFIVFSLLGYRSSVSCAQVLGPMIPFESMAP